MILYAVYTLIDFLKLSKVETIKQILAKFHSTNTVLQDKKEKNESFHCI